MVQRIVQTAGGVDKVLAIGSLARMVFPQLANFSGPGMILDGEERLQDCATAYLAKRGRKWW